MGTTQSQRKLFYRLNKEKQKLEALGVYPAPKLLASTLDVKEEEVEDMEKRLAYTDISLETPVNDESDDTFLNMMKKRRGYRRYSEPEREIGHYRAKGEGVQAHSQRKGEVHLQPARHVGRTGHAPGDRGEVRDIQRAGARQIENKVVKKFKEQFQGELEKLDL